MVGWFIFFLVARCFFLCLFFVCLCVVGLFVCQLGGCFSIVVFPSLEQACPPLDLSFWVDSRRNWNPWVTFHLENEKLTRKGFSQLLFASFNRKTSIQTSQCKTGLPKNLHYFRKPRFYFKHDWFTCMKFSLQHLFGFWSFKKPEIYELTEVFLSVDFFAQAQSALDVVIVVTFVLICDLGERGS